MDGGGGTAIIRKQGSFLTNKRRLKSLRIFYLKAFVFLLTEGVLFSIINSLNKK